MVTHPIVGKLYRIEKSGTAKVWNSYPDHTLVTVLEVDTVSVVVCIDTDGFEQCVEFSELAETNLNPKREYPTLSAENAKYLDVIRHKERGDTYLIITRKEGEVTATALSVPISSLLTVSIPYSGCDKFEVLYNLREIHNSLRVDI